MPAKRKTSKKRNPKTAAGKRARTSKNRSAQKRKSSQALSSKRKRLQKKAPKKTAPTSKKRVPSRGIAAAGSVSKKRPTPEGSGDLQGLSGRQEADSESVEELLEEGNAFEASAVGGVEHADDFDEREVHTHEVPEDDVPGEYLDKDS